MNDLEKEAEKYAESSIGIDDPSYTNGLFYGFMAGATNSNYSKQQIIKDKIEVLMKLLDISKMHQLTYDAIYNEIYALKKELKQL